MRPCNYLILAALCLLYFGLRTSTERARAQMPPSGVAATPRATSPSWEVKRFGETADDAKELALPAARDEVVSYFRRNVPALGDWVPTVEALQNKNVISLLGEPQPIGPDGTGPIEAKVKVEITPKSVQELVTEARTERMHDRQFLLARLLAGAVAVLLVTAGYLRLEDATRGYYTTLLRLAAVGLVAVVGAGLWLLA
jgi:hypothetical protein